MSFWYTLLALIVLTLIYMRIEASLLEVKRFRLSSNKDSLRVMFLSDIHIGRLKVPHAKIKRAVINESPDVLLISGDLIEKEKDIDSFIRFLENLRSVPSIYICLGNHDYKCFERNQAGLSQFIDLLENHGINVLNNHSLMYEKNSRRYNIVGIADLRRGNPDIAGALKNCDSNVCTSIAISHNPDIALDMPKDKVDYLFCGHFHGGQIWMPFNLEFKLLRNDKLCKMGISRGFHTVNGIKLYISRGIGNVLFPLRFFSRPEITVFEI